MVSRWRNTASLPIFLLSQRRPRSGNRVVTAANDLPQLGTDTRDFGLSSTLTIAAAISDGSTGFCAADGDVPEISSVLVKVGSTTGTLTACGANSSASAADRPTNAHLGS